MVTLAIDTSTVVCAGLAVDGRALDGLAIGDSRSHVELITPTIQRLLAAAGLGFEDITDVVMGVGPGPFTGLRVGMSTARTLAWTLGLTPKGVVSLDVLALQWACSDAAPGREFVVATDARRQELYWARYDAAGRRQGAPQVSAPTQLPDRPVGGPGVLVHPALLGDRIHPGAPVQLDAGFLAAHAAQLPDAGVEPAYLRKPDAAVAATRKSALGGDRLVLRAPVATDVRR